MRIQAINETVLLPDKKDILRVQLYFKLVQYGIKPFENDMDIIIELYTFGGYSTPEEQDRFIGSCLEKEFKKSDQSLRNTLSKYVILGVFDKPRNSTLYLNEKYIPRVECDKLVLQYTLSHAK